MSDEKLDRILDGVTGTRESIIRLEEQFKAHLKDHADLRTDHEAVAGKVMAIDMDVSEAKTTLRNVKWFAGATGLTGPALWVALTKWLHKG